MYNNYSYEAPGMDPGDRHGHGSHCAGTIGSRSYGVAKEVSIVDVKVLTTLGLGTVGYFIGGLEFIIGDHAAREEASGKCQ